MGRLSTVVGTAFVGAIALGAARTSLMLSYERAAVEVCDLVGEHYYRRNEPEVREAIGKCRSAAESQVFLSSKAANIERINDRLAEIKTSHLSLYNPEQNRQIWENQGLDTGIRSRFVDDLLVVTKVVPESPAEKAGLKKGDALIAVNGEALSGPYAAQTASGTLTVERKGEGMAIDVKPVDLSEDLSPTLHALGDGVLLVTMPSFLSQYWEAERWREMTKIFANYKRIVVDLRDNAGGSFPAMLRALSPFRCEAPFVGSLYQPMKEGLVEVANMKDTLEARSQLEQLTTSARLKLRAFDSYGCYDGPVTVLIDSGTSSTAEIFAQSFYSRKGSRVWGHPSAGQVVMAQWFPVGAFGNENFALSIPIAGYETADGLDLENVGLRPQRVLQYDLDTELAGRDTWIEAAKQP